MLPRSRLVLLVPTLGLVVTSVALAGASSVARPSGVRAGSQAQQYVVSFEGDAQAARQRVTRAGGQVVDVVDEIGVALVRTGDDGFVPELRGQQGIGDVALNHAVGTARPDMPHRFAEELPGVAERAEVTGGGEPSGGAEGVPPGELLPPAERAAAAGGARGVEEANDLVVDRAAAVEPLAERQWDMAMIGATPDAAHQQATGAGVDVGIIDTGVDGNHPDIAPNFDRVRSKNFTVDRPDADGPCEAADCIDPPDVDDAGHGTHVAGTVAAARNGFGMVGVAPEARLVNLRAGHDSGYFFVYEVAKALVAAGDMGLDVVNMSFFTDPWMYNCVSRREYVTGEVTEEELAQQKLTRDVIIDALEYAHDRGVTLVAAAGNEHTDLAAPQREDDASPGFPPGSQRPRTVQQSCLDLPNEGPHVISVSSLGPSGVKADYSNYGHGRIEVAAPGGWLRDGAQAPDDKDPSNMVLSAYPQDVAIEEELAGPDGQPVDAFSVRQCDSQGVCGFYAYMQGTSMAAPHVAGVAALVIQRYGEGSPETGYRLDPDRVARILTATAVDRPCPPDGVLRYGHAGRDEEWTAVCHGSPTANGIYGEGIVNATAALQAPGERP